MKKSTIIKMTMAVAAMSAVGIAAFWDQPVVRRYTVNAPIEGVRLLLLSDLHGYIYGQKQDELVNLVLNQKPDIILLAGDIADYQVGFEGTALFLEGIEGFAPIYYVTGNHEYFGGSADHISEMLAEDYGVIFLSDEYREIVIKGQRLIIAGIEDPVREFAVAGYNQLRAMERAFGGLEAGDGVYKILLAHRPERYATYLNYPFDLILSGHTHGGQVRLPFLINGLYSPNQGFFPKYAGGIYQHGETVQIVSRGIGLWPELARIFNPPEICVVDFNGK